MYDDVNLTKPRREPKYNALVSYTRMRRKLKIEYLLPGGRVVQARCRILSSLLLNAQSLMGIPYMVKALRWSQTILNPYIAALLKHLDILKVKITLLAAIGQYYSNTIVRVWICILKWNQTALYGADTAPNGADTAPIGAETAPRVRFGPYQG